MPLRHRYAVGAGLVVVFSCLFVYAFTHPPSSGRSVSNAPHQVAQLGAQTRARARVKTPREVIVSSSPLQGEVMSDRELAIATFDDLRARSEDFLARMEVKDVAIAVQSQHEAIAQTLHDLLDRTPDAEPAFAAETEQRLCDPRARRHDLLLFAKLGLRLESSLTRGLGCLLARGKVKGDVVEDDVLWAALDLWRASDTPPPPALLTLAEQAKDARTLRRLTRSDDFVP